MKHQTLLWSILLMVPFLFAGAQTTKPDDLIGKWLNADKDAHIQVFKDKGKYYGKIIWLKEPIDPETGKAKVDKHNPEAKLRSRPTMGLIILKDFVFSGEEWEDGTIYDPKSGNTYKCYIKLDGKQKIFVRGYIGKAWMGLGRTTEWTRVAN
ncbi:MAG: DUF2147 domain-containing protein [Bacteroidales bacterium]|nr:DUF2147 domain-containing protein [Bacteroidales bacterium]